MVPNISKLIVILRMNKTDIFFSEQGGRFRSEVSANFFCGFYKVNLLELFCPLIWDTLLHIFIARWIKIRR